MMRKRRFNPTQKAAMYIAADGKCAICGRELPVSWHSDHVHPYSKGGETDVLNSQPLCPDCNRKKGSKTMLLPQWTKSLREWQNIALEKFQTEDKQDFLLVATPGAGKTTFALRVAHYLLQSEIVQQIVVLCPTANLKEQWTSAANSVGINLDPEISNTTTTLRSGFHSMVTTYQQVSISDTSAELFRYRCKKPTFVILDEIHHAGEEKSWGDKIRYAFEAAKYRLALSGTPFRTDNNPIPFVTYVRGESQSDHTYGYADSLRDGVCRYVFFPKYEGKMEWISGQDGNLTFATFADELNQRKSAERLNTAITAHGNWIGEVIEDANRRLTSIRNGEHYSAAGLIIARDQKQAEQIGKLVFRITGKQPVIAVSDDRFASQRIEAFKLATDPWIVAVKMVSEGVDIPRLRIAIYATNVTSELFFRQAVGRVVRHISGLDEQSAFFYIPDDPTLKAHAFKIKEERAHFVFEEDAGVNDVEFEDEAEYNDGTIRIPSQYVAISAEAERHGAIFDKNEFSQEEIDRAAQYAQQIGMQNPEAVAHLRRLWEAENNVSPTQNALESLHKEPVPLHKQLKVKRDQVNYLVGKFVALSGLEYQDVHNRWMSRGGKPQSQADLPELDRKIQWLKQMIEDEQK